MPTTAISPRPGGAGARRQHPGQRFPAGAQVAGEGAHRGVPEEVDQREVAAQELAQPALHADEQQRVAAEIEEVVVDPHLGQPQDLPPDPGDGPLRSPS